MGLKVTDIQDKNSQTREIQDKDLANQTSVSQVNTSDYIMLQDTSGGYHKIARTSFVDAIRDAIGPEIANVAKGTDIAKIPVLDSSNGLGMGTLANVASVLGVLGMPVAGTTGLSFGGTATGDADTFLKFGLFYSDGMTNLPGLYSRGLFINNYYVQVFIPLALSGESGKNLYFRTADFNRTWTNWVTITNIPSFYKDYNSLSSLASALGVTYIYHMNDISNSFDNPPFEGRKVSIGIYDESSTHNLTGNYSGLLISFKTYSGLNSSVKTASVIELNINISAYADGPDITSLVSATKIRYKNGESGTWSAWV